MYFSLFNLFRLTLVCIYVSINNVLNPGIKVSGKGMISLGKGIVIDKSSQTEF